jgi:bifunctional non-homologous end joining protein LigD
MALARRQHFLVPQLATLVDAPPTGTEWTFEVKYDGYRLQALIDQGEVRLLTRRGHDWTARFPTIAARVARVPVASATLDGEIVALDESGRSAFNHLQLSLDASADRELTYFAFDLLYLDGVDLRPAPLADRRAQLERLLRRGRVTRRGSLRIGERMSGNPATLIGTACQLGLEGIIGKRLDAPYVGGRNRSWVKIKCGHRQEFVVIGFTPPRKSRVGLGSLMLAVNAAGTLRYAGRVGSGFADALLRDLLRQLKRHERRTTPLPARPAGIPGDVHWTDPVMVVEVAFTEWTSDGLLRHPVFQGVRLDKPASEVHREEAAVSQPKVPPKSVATADATVAGVRITHPDRVVFPELGITKMELAQHFERVAPLMLPHVAGRPLSLVRCPEGSAHECFFQKHWTGTRPPSIDTVAIRQSDGKNHPHVVVHDVEGLVTLVQWGVMEIHPWGSRADDPERPDRIIFDLDPGPGVSWGDVTTATLGVRALLDELGLDSWVKTSGGKGLHVEVPIARRASWDEVSDFARNVARQMQQTFPERFIAKASKAARKELIFVDWMRNTRGATAVAPWSTRARANAGVSVPMPWSQVPRLSSGDQFTLLSVRASRPRSDPWQKLVQSRQALTRQIVARSLPHAPDNDRAPVGRRKRG